MTATTKTLDPATMHATARRHLAAALRLHRRAERRLAQARAAVAGVAVPAYATRDVRFEEVRDAADEIRAQEINVRLCAIALLRITDPEVFAARPGAAFAAGGK